MVTVIGSIGFVFLLAGPVAGVVFFLYGLIKIKKMPLSRSFYLMAGGILGGSLLFGAGIFMITSTDKMSDSIINSAKTDKVLFLAYYKTLLAKAKPIDVAYRKFSDPLTKKDHLRAVIVAKNMKDDMNQRWGELYSIDVPSLANSKASTQLKDAHEIISLAYLYKIEILEKYLEIIKQPSLYSVADFLDNAEKHQQQLYGGLLKVMAVGQVVGVKPEEFPKGNDHP